MEKNEVLAQNYDKKDYFQCRKSNIPNKTNRKKTQKIMSLTEIKE